MKIATWNVNSIRTRQDIVKEWLAKNLVDVLCLQETKVIDADFPRSPFEELGYHLYISGQKAYNGVAIFSLNPMEDVSTGFAPIVGDLEAEEFESQKRVITGIMEGIRIVNLYVPNGGGLDSDKYHYKLGWLSILRKYLEVFRKKEQLEICICGDFNIALEDIDIYNPKGKENHIMSSPPEREALNKVLEIGFFDVFRKFTSEGGYYTWWDYRGGGFQRNRGWRIDTHYLTSNLYEKVVNSTIDKATRGLPKPSDHAPVILEL